jgi:hypothetical protein
MMKSVSFFILTSWILLAVSCNPQILKSARPENESFLPETAWRKNPEILLTENQKISLKAAPSVKGTLFVGITDQSADPVSVPDPEESLWIEKKVIPVTDSIEFQLELETPATSYKELRLCLLLTREKDHGSYPAEWLRIQSNIPQESSADLFENFDRFPESSSVYETGIFSGTSDILWSYTRCAGSSTGEITGKTPYLGKNQVPISSLQSSLIQPVYRSLSFDYRQVFTTACSFSLIVTDENGGILLSREFSTDTKGTIISSGEIPIDTISVPFKITWIQNTGGSGQVSLDNLMLKKR